MQSAKIEQLRKDIAALEAGEEAGRRRYRKNFSLFGWIEDLKAELKRLENAAYPAEVVRADQLKVGDTICDWSKLKKIENILTERRPDGKVRLIVGGGTVELAFKQDYLVTRLVDAPPDDTAALKAEIERLAAVIETTKVAFAFIEAANASYSKTNEDQEDEIETLKAENERLRAERNIEIVKAGDLKEGDKFLWKTATCKVMAKFNECEAYVTIGINTPDLMYFYKNDPIARIVEAKHANTRNSGDSGGCVHHAGVDIDNRHHDLGAIS